MEIKLAQIVAIGIYNSHIAVKNTTVTKARKTTMFEIELPMEKGGVSYINSEEMPIGTDMIICAKPGQIRHTRLPFKCYYIHMILRDGALYDALMDTPNFIKTYKTVQYYDIFNRLCKYYDSAVEDNEIILHSLILELIYVLVNDSKKLSVRDKTKANNDKAIEAVINYIHENLTANLTLEALATVAGFSPVYFHNTFKASTGKTLHDYVEEQRIKKAANMLIKTNHTLTTIAYECGFSSQSYFSYAFKRRMKMTPREYAQKISMRYEEEMQD